MTFSPPEIPVVDLCSSQESDHDYNHTVGNPPQKRKRQELDEDTVNSTHMEKKRRNFDGSIPSTSGLNVQNIEEDTLSLDSASGNETQLTRLNFIKLTERVMRMERAMENRAGTRSILSEKNPSSLQSETELLNDEKENLVQKKEFETVLSRINDLEVKMKNFEGTMERLERNVEKHTMIVSALKSIFSDISEQSEDGVSLMNNPTVYLTAQNNEAPQDIGNQEESRIPVSIPEAHNEEEIKEATMSLSSMLPDSNQGEGQHLPIQMNIMNSNAGKQSVHSTPVKEGSKEQNKTSMSTSTTVSASPAQPVEGGKNPAVAQKSIMLPNSNQGQDWQVPTHEDVIGDNAGKKSVEKVPVRNNPGTKKQDDFPARTSTTTPASPAQPVAHGKNPPVSSASNMRRNSHLELTLVVNSQMCATATKGLESSPARNSPLVPRKLNELVARTTVSSSPTKPVVGGKNLAVTQQLSTLPNSNEGQDQQVRTHKDIIEGSAATRGLLITPVKNNQGPKKQNGHPLKTSTPTSASPAQPVISGKIPSVAAGSNMGPDFNQGLNAVLNSSKRVAATTGLESTPPRNHQLVTKKQNELAIRPSPPISASLAQPVVGGKTPAVQQSSMITNSNRQVWHGSASTPTKSMAGNGGEQSLQSTPARKKLLQSTPARNKSLQSTPARNNQQGTEKQKESPIRTSASISVVPTQLGFASVASGSNTVPTRQDFAPVASGSNIRTDTNQGLNPHLSIQKKTYSSSPTRVLPSNAGIQSIQSATARINDQARSNTLTGATETGSIQVTPQCNIRIKQELVDSLERTSEVNLSPLNTHTDGRIHIFICSRGRKIKQELDKYVAQYGILFIHNQTLQFEEVYISDLKTTDVKRQAEVLAATHALKELESRVGSNLRATIMTKYKGLVSFMEKHKKFFQQVNLGQCSCRPVCQSWRDHLTKEQFSKPFPDDMLLLVNRVKSLDVEWVQEDSSDIRTKHQTQLYREKVIQILDDHMKNKESNEFVPRGTATGRNPLDSPQQIQGT